MGLTKAWRRSMILYLLKCLSWHVPLNKNKGRKAPLSSIELSLQQCILYCYYALISSFNSSTDNVVGNNVSFQTIAHEQSLRCCQATRSAERASAYRTGTMGRLHLLPWAGMSKSGMVGIVDGGSTCPSSVTCTGYLWRQEKK